MEKDIKKIEAYWKKHPWLNGLAHMLGGMGLGILVTYPVVGAHPVRWGVALLVAGVAMHVYPLMNK